MKKKYYSDMKRLRSLKDEEIDTSDIPELDASFFEKAVISLPKPKTTVCIRLDKKKYVGQGQPINKQSL